MPDAAFGLADLTQKTIVITGANSGIGYEAARAFARRGARVVLACRNLKKAATAEAAILRESPAAALELLELDLASLASVRDFAAVLRARFDQLHVLVNNAGVMALPRMLTTDGFEMQFGVNHLGHFALTGLLLDRLLTTPGARVVNVSSLASMGGKMSWDDLDGASHYRRWGAYCQSKLANLLFTFELGRRFGERRVDVRALACHPGYAATNLQLVAPEIEGSRVTRAVMQIGNRFLARSAESGAIPTVYAATASDAQAGEFIGPPPLLAGSRMVSRMRAKRAAYDPVAMRRLWELSVERTGVDYAVLASG